MRLALARMGGALLLGGSFLLAGGSGAVVDLVGRRDATFFWDAAPGPVAGYAVYVARNGGGFPAVPEVVTPAEERTARIVGQAGDHVVVRVAAFDAASTLGPFSPSSEEVRFLDPVPVEPPPAAPAPDPSGATDPGVATDTAGTGAGPGTDTTPLPGEILYAEDFEALGPGADPPGWLDTGAGNALTEAPELFSTVRLADGNTVLATVSTAVNIHSHWLGEGSRAWSAYELAGRMQVTDAQAGIGVTVFSDYPSSDTYYRLRRWADHPFHLAPHDADPEATCVGSGASTLHPKPGVWAHFRFAAEPSADGTRLRAKLWHEGDPEPAGWEIDCLDPRPGAFRSGHVGVWSMGPGEKYWDDFVVRAVADPVSADPGPGGGATRLYAEDFEGLGPGTEPPGWLDTDIGNALTEASYLFETVETEGGNLAFGTRSVGVNIHSHLVVPGSEIWSGYELRGRMRVAHRWGGVGVTLHSDYPSSDRYYRLRRYWGNAFHLAPHGAGSAGACVGATDTGVVPLPGAWYRFRFRAEPEPGAVRVRAKVWRADGPEPPTWQVDCRDARADAPIEGRPGVWSMGPGDKQWDDLEVWALSPPGGP